MVKQTPISEKATTSLRIYTLSGEELSDLPELPEHATANHLKQQLQITHGMPRFRQRLYNGANALQDQDEIAFPAELHLVLLSYIPATKENVLELIQACDQGAEAQVAKILYRPQDVNAPLALPKDSHDDSDDENEYGDRVVTALQAAARENHECIIELLLEARANMHAPGNNIALWWAAGEGSARAVQVLLRARAELDSTNTRGETALLEAAWQNRDDTADLLIQARANLESYDNYDRTPLIAACIADSQDVAISLLRARADLKRFIRHEDAMSIAKTTAMCAAAIANHPDSLAALLEADANINDAGGTADGTALWHAAKEGNVEAVELLLLHKADPNVDNAEGEGGSALCAATFQGNNAVVAQLLRARANPNLRSFLGEPPLILACMQNKPDTAQLLLHAKAEFGNHLLRAMFLYDIKQATKHRWAQDLLLGKGEHRRRKGKTSSWSPGRFAKKVRRKTKGPERRTSSQKSSDRVRMANFRQPAQRHAQPK